MYSTHLHVVLSCQDGGSGVTQALIWTLDSLRRAVIWVCRITLTVPSSTSRWDAWCSSEDPDTTSWTQSLSAWSRTILVPCGTGRGFHADSTGPWPGRTESCISSKSSSTGGLILERCGSLRLDSGQTDCRGSAATQLHHHGIMSYSDQQRETNEIHNNTQQKYCSTAVYKCNYVLCEMFYAECINTQVNR